MTTYWLAPAALAMIVLWGGAYLWGVLSAAKQDIRWPWYRTFAFFVGGLGSYAWVCFGFLGVYSTQLRWAFGTRMALLLFAIPSLMLLGKPVLLARSVMHGKPLNVLNKILGSQVVKWLGNGIVAPLLTIAAFSMMITPMVGHMRQSGLADGILTIVLPIIGLFMALPIVDSSFTRTSLFITAEFFIAFGFLFLDTIPGILLRVNETVLDGLTSLPPGMPGWWPTPFHDQHLAGDFLWFIFEMSDIPVLAVLIVRWIRTDRSEAKKMDELTDEQMEALTQEHLRRF